MKSEKRGRGRPKGSSRYNAEDKQTLEKVAAILVRNHRLAATTAMRRLGKVSEAELRRLQQKWVEQKTNLLQEARADYGRQRAGRAQLSIADQFAECLEQLARLQQLPQNICRAMGVPDEGIVRLLKLNFPTVGIAKALGPTQSLMKSLELNAQPMRNMFTMQ